jgi:hypothetical protein
MAVPNVLSQQVQRIDYAGARCYIIADRASEYLIFCPDNPVPRSRTVSHDDPQVRRFGITENVFTGLGAPDR